MKSSQFVLVSLFVFAPFALFADPSADQAIEEAAASSYNFQTVLEKQVFVTVENGVVTLTGNVLDQEQQALAEQTARDLPGVREVKNRLGVVPVGPERSDGWIALKIRSVLLLRSDVSVARTDVSVRNGNVTLTGAAETASQKELTEIYARRVEGVRSVTNQMTVEPPIGGGQFAGADGVSP